MDDVTEPEAPDAAALEPAYDPRELTPAELGLLSTMLVKDARMLEWRAAYPRLPESQAQSLRDAAARRLDLASRLMRARVFVRELGPAGVPS